MKTVIEILNDIENEWNKRETGTDFLEGCRNGGIYALREAKERIKKETGGDNLSEESIMALRYLSEKLSSRRVQFHTEQSIFQIAEKILGPLLPHI